MATSTEAVVAQLKAEFPAADDDILESVAYAVSLGRYNINIARQSLKEMAVYEDCYTAVGDAEEEQHQRAQEEQQQRMVNATGGGGESEQHQAYGSSYGYGGGYGQYEEEPSRVQDDDEAVEIQAVQEVPVDTPVPMAAPSSTAVGGGGGLPLVPTMGAGDDEVVYYTTTITSLRQVRDRCRQIRNILYILRIRHHEMDVASNVFMRKKLIQLCGGEDLGLPLLFVGKKPVGGFKEIDHLIENQLLLPKLIELGYEHDPDKFNHGGETPHDTGDDEDGEETL